MSARLVVLYDANVLYPAQLRDLLIRLAVGGLVRAHWTDAIHEEWIRNVLADYSDITREELRRTRRLIEQALPAGRIEGYEHRISSLSLPDPDDRHILAAAIEIGADAIVTFNLDDFPASRLDAGAAGDGRHITLRNLFVSDGLDYFRVGKDFPAGAGIAGRRMLGAEVKHRTL